MVGEVSRLLKTVKNVESEAARGVQSLEKTIDSIESDLVVRPSFFYNFANILVIRVNLFSFSILVYIISKSPYF